MVQHPVVRDRHQALRPDLQVQCDRQVASHDPRVQERDQDQDQALLAEALDHQDHRVRVAQARGLDQQGRLREQDAVDQGLAGAHQEVLRGLEEALLLGQVEVDQAGQADLQELEEEHLQAPVEEVLDLALRQETGLDQLGQAPPVLGVELQHLAHHKAHHRDLLTVHRDHREVQAQDLKIWVPDRQDLVQADQGLREDRPHQRRPCHLSSLSLECP